jgi:anaphase-promoting complex subunit 4
MLTPPQPTEPISISTYILHSPASRPTLLHIHRLTHTPRITQFPQSIHSHSVSTLNFTPSSEGGRAKICDAKFADDKNLLVLLQTGITTIVNTIICLTYTSSFPPSTSPIAYTPLSTPSLQSTLLPKGNAPPFSSRHAIPITRETVDKHTRHIFEGRFTPLKLVVNGRKGRRVIVVLGSDRKHYRVLDMDFGAKKGGEDSGNGSDMEDDASGGDGDGDVEMGDA